MKRFEGRSVLVTGAGSGIGRATAERFGTEGAKVTCVDINRDGVEETAALLREKGVEVKALVCDVSSESSVSDVIADVISRNDKLDVLANVAGIGGFRRTTEVTMEEWNRVIGVNLTGTFLMCQKAIPHLLKTRGVIVNTASIAGIKSHPYSAAYCASKGGVVLLTKALSVEYARKGLRINCVCPGGVETPLIGKFQLPEGVSQSALTRIAPLIDRMGTPAELAGTIAFLASEDASYINGASIVVDGAMTA